MTDILRNNWFVVLIAIIIIGFIGYFIYDTNKDNVSAKTTNNEQVVASINKDDITADDLYDESTPYDGSTMSTICIKMPLSINLSKLQKI